MLFYKPELVVYQVLSIYPSYYLPDYSPDYYLSTMFKIFPRCPTDPSLSDILFLLQLQGPASFTWLTGPLELGPCFPH